ncbi:Ribonuclease Zc3h12a-like protein [Nannochloropsis gaditana]|uniref:Ribonuclease Zc3h12a-like protein n=1 Tax=Nannochloropsis gaditana TaxID=72520 RepID=W7TQR9_9STRA|nr:Ribonuclease Zc3h12a-like protein [Nannochloropsis gaditana]
MHDAPEDAVTTSGPAPLNARIDASRIASAISYFRGRSIGVAAFIPAYALRRKGPGGGRAGGREGGGGNVMMQTEAQESLQSMVDRRWLATIPPTDNDDLYILEFAREKNALVLSNDCFRDHCARDPSLRPFLQRNRVSYTFFANDFLPNPGHVGLQALKSRRNEEQKEIGRH